MHAPDQTDPVSLRLWGAVLVPLAILMCVQATIGAVSTLASAVSGESLQSGWYGATVLAMSGLSAGADAAIAVCLWKASSVMLPDARRAAVLIARAAWVYAVSAILLGIGFHIALSVEMSRTIGSTLGETAMAPKSFADSFFEIGRLSAVLLDATRAALAIWLAARVRAASR